MHALDIEQRVVGIPFNIVAFVINYYTYITYLSFKMICLLHEAINCFFLNIVFCRFLPKCISILVIGNK